MERYLEEYNRWLSSDDIKEDQEMYQELVSMKWNDDLIKECFSDTLHFGTSGLRGVMGAGTDRINIFMVRKVSQGIAEYMRKNFDEPGFIIAYDSRKNSRKFALAAAEVMAGNGIPVYIFREMTPVPVLSYAIRTLDVTLGAVITASHNRKEYNGYKVYNSDGYQITGDIPKDILNEIEKVDIFRDIKRIDIEDAFAYSICTYVDDAIIDGYMESVKHVTGSGIKRRALSRIESLNQTILYTPLYGAGYEFVRKLCPSFETVDTQIEHDGDFPTAPYPNPEKKEAFNEAIRIAEEKNIDYIVATDPDSDRFGLAVRDKDGFKVLTGNEIGILLFNFICETRKLPSKGIAYRSIVTTNMVDAIAQSHKIEMKTTLTGFKYIGEKLSQLSDLHKFIFAFEESNGFLMGTHSFDKDGICACVLAGQMISWYGNLIEALEKLYVKYGYYTGMAYDFPGNSDEISDIMCSMRETPLWEDCKVTDFLEGIDGLPQADILRFTKNDGSQVYMRPSGTEPKLKVYIFTKGRSRKEAEDKIEEIAVDLKTGIKGDADEFI